MIKKTASLIKNKIPYFFAGVFLEILFLFAYGLAAIPISKKIAEHFIIIGTLYSKSLNTVEQNFIQALLSESIKPYFINLLILLFLLVISVYFVYCTFQGLTWYIAHRIVKNKTKFFPYVSVFFKLNILWGIFYLGYFLLSWFADLNFVIATNLTQGHAPEFSFIGLFARIFWLVIFYFATISYITLSNKKSWKLGKSKLKKIIPAYLFIALYYFIINYIIIALVGINDKFGIAIGFLLVFPALIFAKIYLILIIEKEK